MRDRDLMDMKTAHKPARNVVKRLDKEPRQGILSLVKESEDLTEELEQTWCQPNQMR
jgi:hypothetical protein